jgi:inhibitor of cysteine peptidase
MVPLESRLLLSVNPVTVTSDPLDSPPATMAELAAAPGPVTGVGVTIHTRAGQKFTGDVGKLVWATLAAAGSRSFVGSIDWGDGQAATTATSKLDLTGVVHIQGTHTYPKAGTYTIVVQAWQNPPTPTTLTGALITIRSKAIVAKRLFTIHPIAGRAFTGIVGQFVLPASVNLSASLPLRATINWGDGLTSVGNVLQVAANPTAGWDVTGTHTYTKAGQNKIHTIVTQGPPSGPGPQPMASPRVERLIAQIDSLAEVTAPVSTALAPSISAVTLKAALAATLVIKQASNGKTIHATVGDTLRIELPGNPTTGFLWSVTAVKGKSAVQSGKVHYQASPTATGIVGSSGTFTATFKAVKVGKVVVTMAYKRPWETGQLVQRFSVTISVQTALLTSTH